MHENSTRPGEIDRKKERRTNSAKNDVRSGAWSKGQEVVCSATYMAINAIIGVATRNRSRRRSWCLRAALLAAIARGLTCLLLRSRVSQPQQVAEQMY